MSDKCQCLCGWQGSHSELDGEYPSQNCPKCGNAATTHIHDICECCDESTDDFPIDLNSSDNSYVKFKVWRGSQIGMCDRFEVSVNSPEEGAKLLKTLAEYDRFQILIMSNPAITPDAWLYLTQKEASLNGIIQR